MPKFKTAAEANSFEAKRRTMQGNSQRRGSAVADERKWERDRQVIRFMASLRGLRKWERKRSSGSQIVGDVGDPQLCILSDLAARLTPHSSEHPGDAWAHLVRDGAVTPEAEDLSDSFFHVAVELRSPSLLRALAAGGAKPDILATGAGGDTLCHREVGTRATTRQSEGALIVSTLQDREGPYGGVFMMSLARDVNRLDGKHAGKTPPGALLPILVLIMLLMKNPILTLILNNISSPLTLSLSLE